MVARAVFPLCLDGPSGERATGGTVSGFSRTQHRTMRCNSLYNPLSRPVNLTDQFLDGIRVWFRGEVVEVVRYVENRGA